MNEPTSSALTLSVDQAAALIGVGDDAVRRAIARGELPHIKIGTRRVIRIHREGLEEWLREAAREGRQI